MLQLSLDGNLSLDAINYRSDGMREPLQGTHDRKANYIPDLLNEYARGALCIIIQLDTVPQAHDGDVGKIGSATNDHITFHSNHNISGAILDSQWRMAGCSKDGDDCSVLVRIIELADLIEIVTSTVSKGFRGSDGLFGPLAWCFYCLAGSFKVDPVRVRREREVAILRAAIQTNKFPHHMVQGTAQIVDSITYYKGQNFRDRQDKTNPDGNLMRIGVSIDRKSVWFFSNKIVDYFFDIRNVAIGPLDFLFRTLEQHNAS